MIIRDYTEADAAVTLEIFRRAIDETARSHYSREQTDVWRGRAPDPVMWHDARRSAGTIVAEIGGRVVGYSDVGPGGHVDHLYVEPDASRQGIGSALLARVIEIACDRGIHRLDSRVSLVARPVFERAGFSVLQSEIVVVAGVPLDRFIMALDLPESSAPAATGQGYADLMGDPSTSTSSTIGEASVG